MKPKISCWLMFNKSELKEGAEERLESTVEAWVSSSNSSLQSNNVSYMKLESDEAERSGVVGTPMEELGVVEMESTEESWESCMDINSMLKRSGES